MRKQVIVEPLEVKGNQVIIRPSFNLANDDWIRAARLKKQADNGDKEAKNLLDEIEKTPMVKIEEGG